MFKTVNALNSLVGAILSLAILTALATGGWFIYQGYFGERIRAQRELEAQQAKIADLTEELENRQRQIERLETALRLLKVDHRVAQIDVLSQHGSAENGDLVTHFSFVELDQQGNALDEPRIFSVNGDIVYVDSWVVKFTDEYVEMGDPLRSTSVCLFRRVFGETQKPSEGFSLDPVGSQPAAYRNGGKMSDFEKEIWAKFWEYANDQAMAQEAGVRAAHGEAPYLKLMPGKRYKLELRASGGLTFVPEDLPPEAKPRPAAGTL